MGRGASPARPHCLAEERQQILRGLVGDRQRLDGELLLGLERPQLGALRLHVRVHQRADRAVAYTSPAEMTELYEQILAAPDYVVETFREE